MRIEIGRRLIGQHQIGIRRQRARHSHALLLAAGHLIGPAVFKSFQPHLSQPAVSQLEAGLFVHPLQLQHISDILARTQYADQIIGLKDKAEMLQAEIGARGCTHRQHILSGNRERAGIGPIQPAEHIEQRRLARSRTPGQHHIGAAINR